MLRQYHKFHDYLKNEMCNRRGYHVEKVLSIRMLCGTEVVRFHNTIYLLVIRYREETA